MYNRSMRRLEASADDARLTLRVNPDLWRRLRILAAKRNMSATLLINELLERSVSDAEREEARSA